jgi:hypothetical protein
MDLKEHLLRQMAFSHATFGPGERTQGVIDHIRKELIEVENSNGSALEWVDIVILALDGLTRELTYSTGHGGPLRHSDPRSRAELACQMILHKQAINEARDWPDWRKAPAGRAIEHDRSNEAPVPETPQ